MNLTSQARLEDRTSEICEVLEPFTATCKACHRFEPGSRSFQVRAPESVIFYHEVVLDMIFLDRVPVLHAVETELHFGSVMFLRSQSMRAVFSAFLRCWATIHLGFSQIKVEQGI